MFFFLPAESKPSSSRGYQYTLYVPAKNAHEEQWEGARTGPDAAVTIFGADQAYPNTVFSSHLSSFIDDKPVDSVYIELPPLPSTSPSSSPYPTPDIKLPKRKPTTLGKLLSGSGLFSSSGVPPHIILHGLLQSQAAKPLAPEVQALRMVKSARELELMKKAGAISSDGHARIMRASAKALLDGKELTESMLVAEFEYYCAMQGSERPAYVPVVASG